MSHVEQLERETEQTRSQIAGTLDELEARITPGHVVEQLADRLSDGAAAAFARNLKDQTLANPLALALVGAGLAWLMLSPRGTSGGSGFASGHSASDGASTPRSAAGAAGEAASAKSAEWTEKASRLRKDARESLGSITEQAKRTAADMTGDVRETAGTLADSTQVAMADTTDSVRRRAGSIAGSTRQAANQTADALRGTADVMSDSIHRTASAVSVSTKAAGQRTLQSASVFLDFCREQPMVLAGLGLAAGALMGALLPVSETEGRLMGEASDDAKERAKEFGAEQFEAAKKVGERAFDAAKEEAAKQAKEQHEEQRNGGEMKDGKQSPAGEVKANGPTLVPSDKSELERQGQPWTADNAPV
ncbi:DUF3618 domain-containing protein [Bradyrhizobium sp. ORS 111]|uniref:DUF3618 domain-containing protein n=1 Tax=Bradyrhizobium sp. ORS 111 TaxID=1685958 RepID=UPI00388D57D4